jgi:hypothetical protein
MPELSDVLITEQLYRRSPKLRSSTPELLAVVGTMAKRPEQSLDLLVKAAMDYCGCGSAGVSVLTDPGDEFEWSAVAGGFAQYVKGRMPRNASPCGVVLERDSTLLFHRPQRYFPAADVKPAIEEVLLTPFYENDSVRGTVWLMSHDPDFHFNPADAELMIELSRMASSACVLWRDGRLQ